MGSVLDFLTIITILTVGAGIWRVINRFGPCTFRKTEYFNIFLLLGSFSLIFPLTWIGIQPDGIFVLLIGEYSIRLIDFPGWCMLYFTLGLIIAIIAGYYLLRKILASLEHFQIETSILKDYRIVLLGFLLFDYFVLELILPLRGFDALYYYLPEAEVFYQTGRITEVNYLSFLPVVKSPLNVLLYVYSYNITGELAIQLIPFLFLLGLVLLIYDFSLELFDNHSLALIAAIFTLVLPFTYWLMNYWAFYQDLYLCYFFSVTCYFNLKWHKTPRSWSPGLFMAIGLVTSLLTKITAWVLPIILVLWLPTSIRGKIIRVVIISILGVFLFIQAATRIFIGASLIVIVSLGAATYFIVKENTPDYTTRIIIKLVAIGTGVVLGSSWLINRMLLSSSVWKEIFEEYFNFTHTIIWTYPRSSLNPLLQTLETVHRINFISATGILLLGTCFVLPWIVLKIYALMKFRSITAPLIWILTFFGIWITYYLNGSIRYLSPIITPIILCISWGFYQLTIKIDDKAKGDFIGILFAFLGSFSIYYLIPLDSLSITSQTQEIIGLSYNQAAVNYYSYPFLLIRFLLATVFSLLIFAFIRKDLMIQLLNSIGEKINIIWVRKLFQNFAQFFHSIGKRMKIERVRYLLLCGTIIIPLAVQSYLLLYTQGDLAKFHAIHEYEYREEYKDLIAVLQQQNQPLAAILTVRTPGLQIFTKQPVIDIYYQQSLFPGDPFFTSSNMTEIIDVLQNPLNHTIETDFNFDLTVSIRFIVVPSTSNLYYNNYLSKIESESYLFQSLENDTYFNPLPLSESNSDFKLYEVKF